VGRSADLRLISARRACASASALSAAGTSPLFGHVADTDAQSAVPEAEFSGMFSVIAMQEAIPSGNVKAADALLKYVT
jgi:hypothetical protein